MTSVEWRHPAHGANTLEVTRIGCHSAVRGNFKVVSCRLALTLLVIASMINSLSQKGGCEKVDPNKG